METKNSIKYKTNRVVDKLAHRKAANGLLKDRAIAPNSLIQPLSSDALTPGTKVRHMIRNHVYGSSAVSTKSKGFAPVFFVGEIVDVFATTVRLKLEKDGKAVYKVVKASTCYSLEG